MLDGRCGRGVFTERNRQGEIARPIPNEQTAPHQVLQPLFDRVGRERAVSAPLQALDHPVEIAGAVTGLIKEPVRPSKHREQRAAHRPEIPEQ